MSSQIVIVVILYLDSMTLLVESKCRTLPCQSGTMYHCIADENDQIRNICLSPKLIPEGHCPYYNTYQGHLDVKACDSRVSGDCPDIDIYSNDGSKYKGCINVDVPPSTLDNILKLSTDNVPDDRENFAMKKLNSTVELIQTLANNIPEKLVMRQSITSGFENITEKAETRQGVNTRRSGLAIVISVPCAICIAVSIIIVVIVVKRNKRSIDTKNSCTMKSTNAPNDTEMGLTAGVPTDYAGPDLNNSSDTDREEDIQV